MINYSQIRCFLKVAEYLNYNRAADDLCLSVTAVSKQVKNLEQRLHERLFIRNTRHVELTPFGQLMIEKFERLVQESLEIEEFIESRQKIPQGKLTILVSNILARNLVLDHLADFIKQYPLIQCEFLFSEQDNDLTRKEIDIMVGFPEIPPLTDNFKYRKMKPINNILCAAPSLIKQYGLPKSSQDLMNYPFISHSLRRPATQLPLANGKHLSCPPPILFMDDFNALNQACMNGIGLFLTGDRLVENELKQERLTQVLSNIKFKQYDIYTFYQPHGLEIPKIKAFIDFYQQFN